MRYVLLSVVAVVIGAFGFVVPVHAQGDPLEEIRAYLKISDTLSTGGQITYEQIPLLEDAGFEVVINLAIADEERNAREGFLVVEQGLTYVHIPVSWENPDLDHLEQFFDAMDTNRDRRVFVHCFANMRVSAFTYLYRTQRANVSDEAARADLQKIWDPFTNERAPQWGAFIEAAKGER